MSSGLYRKYNVERLNDHAGKHKNCRYFVLDLDHDVNAYPALEAYAKACEKNHPELAADLRWICEHPYLDGGSINPTCYFPLPQPPLPQPQEGSPMDNPLTDAVYLEEENHE